MNIKRISLTLIALFIIVSIFSLFWQMYQPQPIQLQGQIEAKQHMVSSKIPGRVATIYVRKGEWIAAGSSVFQINSPELEAKLTQVNAIETISQALVQALDKGTREESIAAARSEFEKAAAAALLAKTTYQRIKSLAEEGLVARQRADEAFTLWQVAEKTRETAAQILQLAETGPRTEAKTAAQGAEAVTSSLRDEITTLLADTLAKAHVSGTVSNILLNEGELAPMGFPVVMLTDMEDAWALFNVREDLLHQFAEGTEFSLFIPALKQSAKFRVSHIAVLGDFATWRATTPGKGFDMRTFEVEMRPTEPITGLRSGLSIILEIQP
ncbi:HlyD family secretion protein [Alishewanella sp. d11]|uniref:HlyD family secretion protein n=1 Tax=Alishewanella sp. d11 TaxID=3414030 RepID=UPI003BF87428